MQEDHQSNSPFVSGVQIPAEPLSSPLQKMNDSDGIIPHVELSVDRERDQESKWKFAEETHQYVREQIRSADQKAIFFFAGATALLGYMHNHGLTNRWVVPPTTWGFVDMLAFLATICLILSAMACIRTVVPRLKGSMRGFIFFAAICQYDNAQAYVTDIMKQDRSKLCEAKLKHICELSSVCTRKYDMLKWGQWFGIIGVIAVLLLFIFLK